MKSPATDWIALFGRVLMSAIFIRGGYLKALAPAATMAMFHRLGLPLPGAAYAVALAVELGVGFLFLIGFRPRTTGLILAAWCVATAMVAHDHPGNAEQMMNFMKNVAMAGGFLQIVAFGPGRFSLDRG